MAHPTSGVGLTLVVLLAPLVALIASSAEVLTITALAAGIGLLLVVLWSAEATFYVLVFSMLLSPELFGPPPANHPMAVLLEP